MRGYLMLLLLLPPVFAAAPLVEEVNITSQVFLISGDSVTVYCNATFSDEDGYRDISASATFFDLYASYDGARDDRNDHYSDDRCVIEGSGTKGNVTCSFRVWYYANPGDWACNISISDRSNQSFGFGQTVVESLMSIDVSSLYYQDSSGGTIPNGRVSAESVMNITNLGNVDVGIDVSGTPMSCTIGSIEERNQKYSLKSGFSWEEGISLTDRAAAVGKFTVPQRTDDSLPSVGSLYWLLLVPGTGVGGNCSGTMNVDAG